MHSCSSLSLSGGIITQDRAERHQQGDPLCLLCGRERDTEWHRLWQCCATSKERTAINVEPETLPYITAITGIFIEPCDLPPVTCRALQQHLVHVHSLHTQAYHRRQQGRDHDVPTSGSGRYEDGLEGDGGERGSDNRAHVFSLDMTSRGVGALESRTIQRPGKRADLPRLARPGKPNPKAAPLPEHIKICSRAAAGSHLPPAKALHCTCCGALADMVNRARFCTRHLACKDNPQPKKGKRVLSRETKSALSQTLKVDLFQVHKRVRRQVSAALVELHS